MADFYDLRPTHAPYLRTSTTTHGQALCSDVLCKLIEHTCQQCDARPD